MLGWFYLSTKANDAVRSAGVIQAATVLFLPVLGVLIHPLRSVHRTGLWNLLRILLDSSLVAAALLILMGYRDYGGLALAEVVWLATLTAVAALVWTGQRRLSGGSTSRQLVAFGLPTMLATLPYFLNFKVDQLLLLAFTDSHELGVYATAVTWSAASLPVMMTVAHLTLPRMVSKQDDRAASAARLTRVGLLLGAGCAVAACHYVSGRDRPLRP